MGTQEGRGGTLVGSGSRGSPWTLEPVQKEVRKLPHAGPSLGVSLGTSYLYLKTLLGDCLLHEAFPETSNPILQNAKCLALQYPFSSLSNIHYCPENGILD